MRALPVLLGFSLAAASGLPAQAAARLSQQPVVEVNGTVINTPAFILRGHTVIPVRGVFQALSRSIQVGWVGSKREVTVNAPNNDIRLWVGRTEANICTPTSSDAYCTQAQGWRSISIAQPPMLKAGHAYIPLRFIGQSVGVQVGWNSATDTVTVNGTVGTPGSSGGTPGTTSGASSDVVGQLNATSQPASGSSGTASYKIGGTTVPVLGVQVGVKLGEVVDAQPQAGTGLYNVYLPGGVGSPVVPADQYDPSTGTLIKSSSTSSATPPSSSTGPQGTGAYLGIIPAPVPSDWSVSSGCQVEHVIPGTPASQAGLIGAQDRIDPVGDVIDQVNGQQISSCSALKNFLATASSGEQVNIHYWYRKVFLILASWVSKNATAILGSPLSGCPAPIGGDITGAFAGNRIPLSVRVVGPNGSQVVSVILDTGADITTLPDSVLRAVGFTADGVSSAMGIVPGASETVYTYSINGASLQINDHGQWVPLAKGTLQIDGGPSTSLNSLIGPDVLKHGASLTTNGSQWSLSPPCGVAQGGI